jgi:hypothetical protein
MENTQQQTSPETEYFQTLIKRIETQRNDALNNVALLEAELLKAQKIIDGYKKELDELKGNNSSEE